MALYSKPVRLLMKDMADELAKEPTATFTKKDAVAWFSQKYPKIKTGTVTAHLIRLSTNAQSKTHYNAKPGEDDVLYQIDSSHFRHYRPVIAEAITDRLIHPCEKITLNGERSYREKIKEKKTGLKKEGGLR